MRPLSSHFSRDALPTLDTFLKHSKEARVFRRAQAVREVVAGQTIKAVSTIFVVRKNAVASPPSHDEHHRAASRHHGARPEPCCALKGKSSTG
jgi:hypothetical protein